MQRVALLLSIGFLAACGNKPASSDSEAAAAADKSDAAALAASESGGAAAAAAAASAEGDSAVTKDAVKAEMQAVSAQKAEKVASLPLKPGFYVGGDTACGEASNATLMLVRKSGINTSRVPCDFTAIEKTGPTSFRVTQRCSEGGAAWGTEEHISVDTSTYEIKSDTGFTSKSDSGWENSARYCPQSSLPEPWRNNDLSDLIG